MQRRHEQTQTKKALQNFRESLRLNEEGKHDEAVKCMEQVEKIMPASRAIALLAAGEMQTC